MLEDFLNQGGKFNKEQQKLYSDMQELEKEGKISACFVKEIEDGPQTGTQILSPLNP